MKDVSLDDLIKEDKQEFKNNRKATVKVWVLLSNRTKSSSENLSGTDQTIGIDQTT